MGRMSIIAVVLLSTAACAAHEAPQTVTVDPVAVRKAGIAGEQRAGREAKQVCGELELQGNKDCEGDIARARLGIDARTALPKFTNIQE